MKKAKRSHKVHRVHKAKKDALSSPIMQLGVVFFMIMAFALVAYAAKNYAPPF